MHASHIKNLQPNFQSLLLNFKIYNFVTKKLFFGKKSDLYLMKIHISFVFRKKSDLYLMKIHISFGFREKIKSIFNENTDKFLCLEKIISKKYKTVFVFRKNQI